MLEFDPVAVPYIGAELRNDVASTIAAQPSQQSGAAFDDQQDKSVEFVGTAAAVESPTRAGFYLQLTLQFDADVAVQKGGDLRLFDRIQDEDIVLIEFSDPDATPVPLGEDPFFPKSAAGPAAPNSSWQQQMQQQAPPSTVRNFLRLAIGFATKSAAGGAAESRTPDLLL